MGDTLVDRNNCCGYVTNIEGCGANEHVSPVEVNPLVGVRGRSEISNVLLTSTNYPYTRSMKW